MKRIGKALLKLAIVLAVLIAALWGGITALYWDFFSQAQVEFRIPGLSDGIVPQGFYYLEEQDAFLMSGYMADGSASRIYVRTGAGDERYVNLTFEDGTPYGLHCGGVCANGKFVYIAGETGVDVFLLSDVLSGETAPRLGVIETGYRIDYCDFAGGHLFAGNFYYPGEFEVSAEHHMTTPAGDENHGLIAVFRESCAWEFGVDPTPIAAISTPGRVQGVAALGENRLILSTSYALESSRLSVYAFDRTREDRILVAGAAVPLYYLDSANLSQTLTLPPMSEEIAVRGGRVYVLFESASLKYLFGHLIRGTQVYSLAP